MNALRILQIKTSASHGGAETIVLNLTTAFQERGHKVFSLLAEPGWLLDRMAERGIDARSMGFYPHPLIRQFFEIRRAIHKFKPDVILVHGAQVAVPSVLVALWSHTPCVTVEHNVDDWRFTNKVRNMIDRQLIGRLSQARIAVGSAVAQMILDHRIVRPQKLYTIPNGIKLSEPGIFDKQGSAIRQRFGISDDDFVIVTVGRIVTQKGHQYLLDAVPTVLDSVPNSKFLWLGTGSLVSQFKASIQKRHLSSAVLMPGAVNDVERILAAADIFVLPSLWEGVPIAVLEAMAAHLPIVATAVSGTPEIIRDGATGLLVPSQDSSALARAIIRLASDPELRHKLGTAAEEHVRAEHSIETMCDHYLSLLNDLVNETKGT